MARVHRQAAVIPYRIRKERIEVALVTTSRGKGWIVPKGSVDSGERPRDAAIREAEEEAGLLGVVTPATPRALSPRQRRRPLPRGCLSDARHIGARALARGQAPPSALDAGEDAVSRLREELRPFVEGVEGIVETGILSGTASRDAGPTPVESVYVIRDDVSPSAIAESLQSLLPARHRPIVRRRFTLLDTFDFRVARAGGRLTRAGANGSHDARMAAARRAAPGDHGLAVRSALPGIFLMDRCSSGWRRCSASGDSSITKPRSTVRCSRSWTSRARQLARVRIQAGRARPPSRAGLDPVPTTIALTALRGYEDEYQRLVPVIESRPGLERAPEGCTGVMLRAVGTPEPFDPRGRCSTCSRRSRPPAGARRMHQALLQISSGTSPASVRRWTRSSCTTSGSPSAARARFFARSETCFPTTPSSISRPSSPGSDV